MSDSTARVAFECLQVKKKKGWSPLWFAREPNGEYIDVQMQLDWELWEAAWQASRTSTIKELSGEGARELAERLGEDWWDTERATALIEALVEEKTRALREENERLRDMVENAYREGLSVGTTYSIENEPLDDLMRKFWGKSEARAALKDSPPLTVEEK